MTHTLDRPLIPMLGAGWHFPVACAADGQTQDLQLRMSADEASVRQAIYVILSTSKGERVMRPTFGSNLHKLLFLPNDGTTRALAAFEAREALLLWEPRIEVMDVQVQAGGDVGEQLLIDIVYRLRSTDNRYNLVYPFYLDRALA